MCALFTDTSPVLKMPHIGASTRSTSRQFEVICRVRPHELSENTQDVVINEEKPSITITSEVKQLSKEFAFHKIYNESTRQPQFISELIDQIFKATEQYQDSLVLSYGVTNSGKTYTILGTDKEPGLLPSLLQRIFKEFPSEEVSLMAIQAYNDEFFSLKDRSKLLAKEHIGSCQFNDYQPEMAAQESIQNMVGHYTENRSQADTKSNRKSSRSHAIFKIVCQSISVAIVDLAGSERMKKADSNKSETKAINSSLLVLGKCIHAFRDGGCVPFRQSKLTKVLCEYFHPKSKIFMIAHINRSGDMFHENVNVLEYAAISTKARHLNPHANRSLLKSAKKRDLRSKSKSCLKNKSLVDSALHSKTENAKQPHKKVKQHPEADQEDPLLKIMEADQQRRRKQGMERYVYQILGRIEEFDFYLDDQFEKLDCKDRELIDEMKNTRYSSPERQKEAKISVNKAETRIKYRREILEELEKERLEKQRDAATLTSMQKTEGHDSEGEEGEVGLQSGSEEEELDQNQEKQAEPSFLKKIMRSANKLTSVKHNITGLVENAIHLIKSYSQKKKKTASQRKKSPFLANQEEISEILNNTKEDRGCGSFNINETEDDKRYNEEFMKLMRRIDEEQEASKVTEQEDLEALEAAEQEALEVANHEALEINEDSQLLDSIPHENTQSHKLQGIPSVENKEKLTSISQSDEFPAAPRQSPCFGQKEKTQQKSQQKGINDELPIQFKLPPLKSGKLFPHSEDSDTLFKKDDESTSISSFNEDSNSTTDFHKSRIPRKNSKSRPLIDFKVSKVSKDVSPVRTRSQRHRIKPVLRAKIS